MARFKKVYSKPERYYIDDEEVTEEEFERRCPKSPPEFGVPPMTLIESSECWPKKSVSLGVHTKRIAKMEAALAKHGVPTEFDKTTGQAIIRSNAHQRDLRKALGWINYDGGYGTVTG